MFQYQFFFKSALFCSSSENGPRTKRSHSFLKQCHWTQIRHEYMETVTFQTTRLKWNQLFRLYWSFLCWLACSSQWCNSQWCTCSSFSVPGLVSGGPLGSSCFQYQTETKALRQQWHQTPEQTIKGLWREWTPQWHKGRNHSDMKGFYKQLIHDFSSSVISYVSLQINI